jgi:hypothetical protein
MEANMLAMKLLEETGPNTELSWLLYVVLGFFLLMVLVGWWVSSRKAEQVEVAHEAPSLHPESHEEKVLPDDLVRLEGIGPKVAKVLNPAEIQKSLSAAGMQMMNPAGWIEQAALAEKGDWESLQKLQGELRGGRRR